jgi:probable rRNA maturation factor
MTSAAAAAAQPVLNRQRRLAVPVQKLTRIWWQLCQALDLPPDAATVCLVSSRTMARWNRLYRGKTGPTDVLSFPPGALARPTVTLSKAVRRALRRNAGYLGDIAIAPEVALRQARQAGHSLTNELAILMLHGMLHLLGYDHEADSGQMHRLERRLRRRLGLA